MDEQDDIPPLVSAADWALTPPDVRTAFLSVVQMVRELSARVQDLEAQLKLTSRNSSIPPSSDPPSAPSKPPRVQRGKPKGAQVGHPNQQRPLLPSDQVDEMVVCHPQQCPDCQTRLTPDLPDALPPSRQQVIELPPIVAHVTEYQCRIISCPHCQHLVRGVLPPEAPPGAFGPRLTALIGLLHGRYRHSARETVSFLDEVCGVTVSLGSVVHSCGRMCDALAPLDRAIHERVQADMRLWVDETSWREGTQRGWLWGAVSTQASCFRIHASRGQQALRELIGTDYDGVVHSGRASVYHLLDNQQRQLCWAHIERNWQELVDAAHEESIWAQRMLGWSHELFAAWHAYQRGFYDQMALQQALIPVRLALQELLRIGARSTWDKLQATSQYLLQHWDAVWTFSRIEGLEPTNNRAERALRPAVIWRKSCYGTQSTLGSRFVERMLSMCATCAQQGHELFVVLTEAVRAAWCGQPPPSLSQPPERIRADVSVQGLQEKIGILVPNRS
jgi:transposase